MESLKPSRKNSTVMDLPDVQIPEDPEQDEEPLTPEVDDSPRYDEVTTPVRKKGKQCNRCCWIVVIYNLLVAAIAIFLVCYYLLGDEAMDSSGRDAEQPEISVDQYIANLEKRKNDPSLSKKQRELTGDVIIDLGKRMDQWQKKQLLPHMIFNRILSAPPDIGCIATFENEAIGEVSNLLDEAKVGLAAKDYRLDSLIMQALVKSSKPIKASLFVNSLNDLFAQMEKDLSSWNNHGGAGDALNANTIVAEVAHNIDGLKKIVEKQPF